MSIVPTKQKVWLRADYEFASTFSYRQPDTSAQFAVGVPVPSPATVKLALVDTAIRWSGRVDEGRRVFDLVKGSKVYVVPPPRIVRFRAFIKRLKPREGRLLESTGVRDYFLLDGPLVIYIEVPQSNANEIRLLLQRIRRFGTSDSLCWCTEVRDETPDVRLCPYRLKDLPSGQGGLVARLSDLTDQSEFNGFNPFGGDARQARLSKDVYVLPLIVKRSGETWALLQRIQFSINPHISKKEKA
jgi:CRISPR-associated Cas5-like protein